MLVYEEHFIAGVYLQFKYNDIFIWYMYSPHLISIIKCHHHLPQWQCPLTAILRFQQHFVLDETLLQMELIRFSSHPPLLFQYLHAAFQMDKLVALVDQLTSLQCVIKQLEWCCLCQYRDGLQCLSSNILDFSLSLCQHYVTYVDFESFIFLFQVVFFS